MIEKESGEGMTEKEAEMLLDNTRVRLVLSTFDSFTYNGVTYKIHTDGRGRVNKFIVEVNNDFYHY